MTILLDSSTLIAASLAGHVHHEAIDSWLAGLVEPYATCPITQGALVRIAMQNDYSADEARRLLQQVAADERHEFWPDDLPFDEVSLRGIVGHRQVTDAYLAQLARTRHQRVATLDRGFAALHQDVAELVPVGG